MSKDYYKILEIDKGASKDEIKKAFRKKAHLYHPDKKTGDEARFKEINEAYQTLSDDGKRSQYDRFGSAGPNFGGGQQGGQGFGGFDFSGFSGQGGQDFEFDLNDIFGAFSGGGGGFNPFGQRVRKGRNITLTTNITFKESILGFTHKFKLPSESSVYKDKKEIEINFPPGIENGQTLKVEGYGENVEGGRAGDLLIRVSVEKHKTLRKEGMNLITELSIKLTDSILGATYDVETVDGKVGVKIPKGIKHGQMLRVRGKGVAGGTFNKGDLIIVINLDIPDKLSKEQKKLVEEMQKVGL